MLLRRVAYVLLCSLTLVACSGGTASESDGSSVTTTPTAHNEGDPGASRLAPEALTDQYLEGAWCLVDVAGGKTEFEFVDGMAMSGEPGEPPTMTTPTEMWFSFGELDSLGENEFVIVAPDLGARNTYTRGSC